MSVELDVAKLQEELATINNAMSMLRVLIKAIEDGYFGYDPYYAELHKCYMQRAKEISGA